MRLSRFRLPYCSREATRMAWVMPPWRLRNRCSESVLILGGRGADVGPQGWEAAVACAVPKQRAVDAGAGLSLLFLHQDLTTGRGCHPPPGPSSSGSLARFSKITFSYLQLQN